MGFAQNEAMLKGWTKFQVAMAVAAVLALGGAVGGSAQTAKTSSATAKTQSAKGKSASPTKAAGKSSAGKSKATSSGKIAGGKKKTSGKHHVVSKPTAKSIKL